MLRALLALLTAVLAVGWAMAVAMAGLGIVAAWGAGPAGPPLALFSIGGVLGGLGYGRRGQARGARDRGNATPDDLGLVC